MRTSLMSVCAVVSATGVFAGCMAQAPEVSAERGKELFYDASLGGSSNSFSCAECHPGGGGIVVAGSDSDLAKVINRCIAGPLKGDGLEPESADMRSLVLYIRSGGDSGLQDGN
ncbi:MAG: hypothetical protein J7D60_00835 [Prosthecochloris sp.]|nr:hypothetical protein [Prosthecochloris sp.]